MPVAVDLLANVPILAGLSSVELEEIATYLAAGHASAGESIIQEGDGPSHPIYILLRGSVDVIKGGLDGRRHLISSLAAPSVFGEIEVLAQRSAIASIVAVTDVELALLRRGVFDELVEANRSCVLKVVRNLATTLSCRLAATDSRLAAYFDNSGSNSELLGSVRSALYSSWTSPDSLPENETVS